MFFGKNIFTVNEAGDLQFELTPAIPEYLIAEKDGKYFVSSTLLGSTTLRLEFDKKQDYIPGEYSITEISVDYNDGTTITEYSNVLTKEAAEKIRDRGAISITIKMTPK